MSKQALLYRAHFDSDVVRREVLRLTTELPHIDVFIVGYAQDSLKSFSDKDIFYSRSDLEMLGYEAKLSHVDWQKTTGHNDLPVLRFFRDYPDYTDYWIVEYDVRYTGHWADFFSELNTEQCGLLATTITDFATFPKWAWWSRRQLPIDRVPLEKRWRSFLPFARASHAFLTELDRAYLDGWSGHYEMAWPTVCRMANLKLVDIGGDSMCTPDKWRHKHYSSSIHNRGLFPGTFIFRPSFRDQDIKAYGEWLMRGHMLWHPVKE